VFLIDEENVGNFHFSYSNSMFFEKPELYQDMLNGVEIGSQGLAKEYRNTTDNN